MILILGQREKTVVFENPYYRRTDLVLNFVNLGVAFHLYYGKTRTNRIRTIQGSPIIGIQGSIEKEENENEANFHTVF